MKINCQQHRKAMQLLGLRLRIGKGISDLNEKEEIIKIIKALEKELKLD